ncbi:putative transcriptional regulator, AraC/XylS family [Methylophaga frappieri]|uniref:Putative transcriptional regulator, AraC/XylS family n=1 Tax=Methylophaga frappieri (strain ATCC BAA-2434 / DSM 25690 / JAM7) TaxID=754477 RepID=I1YEM0_METFJ|nr:helix-turn-helix domain-containing protein [Methylophaga frappieri]AFJ01363.1 putative transcriptional regulator, AraC/XylS family [Methylophaga frappieri]
MIEKDNAIRYADLQQMSTHFNVFSKDLDHDQIVLKGLFHHRFTQAGLSVHAGNMVEMYDRTSFVELPPAISFTILLQGQVSFSLGEKHYQLGASGKDGECSAFVLNQPEILSRHFKKGMQVAKLNVFVERDWLERQAQTDEDITLLERLFAHHAVFHTWPVSSHILQLTHQFFALCGQNGLSYELQRASLAFQIVTESLERLAKIIIHKPQTNPQLKAYKSESDKQLKQRIDELLLTMDSLSEMAVKLGLSVSTLQRRFKAAYGMTVNHYCRQRRLEMAKKALLIDKKTIGEAAYIAGYNHASNFINAFKKQFHITPSELVNKNRH